MRHLKCIKYMCSRTQTDLSSHKHFVYWQWCLNQVLCLRWGSGSLQDDVSSSERLHHFKITRRDAALPLSVLAWKKCRIYVHRLSDKQPEVVGSDAGVSQAGVVEDPKDAVCSNLFVLPVKNTEIIFLFFSPSLLSAVNSLCPVTRSVKTKHKWIITMSSYWTLYHHGLVNAVTSVFRNITLRMRLWLWNSCAQISLKYPNNTHSQGKHAVEMSLSSIIDHRG